MTRSWHFGRFSREVEISWEIFEDVQSPRLKCW